MLRVLCLCILAIVQARADSETHSVIIVGAGPAGIAAAVRLLENSITNITILEAEDRIGGRVKTVSFGGGVVDEGAQYCHGEEGNTVYQMVKDLDLLAHTHVIDPDTDKLYYSNGSAIESELAKELNTFITNYSDEVNRSSSNPLGGEFSALYNSTLLTKYKDDPQKLKIVTDGIKFSHDLILMHEGSFSWDTPAAGRHYKACEGDQMMTWISGGYQSFLNVLLQKIPDSSQEIPIDDYVILNTKVQKISWNGTSVKVESSDNMVREADYVVFTPSVGVLQEDHDTLFDPQLPEEKQKAINALGLNAIQKIVLHFPTKWWNDDDKVFYFVWSSEDLETVDFADGPTDQNGQSWVTHLVALVIIPDNPNTLTVWVSGNLIPEIEQTSEQIVQSGAMYVLRKFLGQDYDVSDPDAVLRTQWYTNPNFRGAFSFEKAEFFDPDVSYQDQLSQPLSHDGVPRLLFAGEATHPTIYSTVHGAVETGRREADRIIDLGSSSMMNSKSVFLIVVSIVLCIRQII